MLHTGSRHKARRLRERLARFGTSACRLAASLPTSSMGPSIARQLARAATAPAAIVSRSPESRVPSARASQLCLKELREALTWLELVCALRLVRPAKVSQLLRETHHLIALFEATVNDHG